MDFVYKDGRYHGEEFTGIVTDWSPEFGKDRGQAFNELNAFGYTVLSIQALHDKIIHLEGRLATLENERSPKVRIARLN